MSITTIFQEVAQREEAVFKKANNKYNGDRGDIIFSSTYSLICHYDDVKIEFINELGHQNIGTIYCQIEEQPKSHEFTIETRNSFFQFFNRASTPLIVKTESPQLKNFIEQNAYFNQLKLRAKSDRFEPEMFGKNEDGKYTISCQYHLVFNNKELVITPFLHFFKTLSAFLKNKRMRYQ